MRGFYFTKKDLSTDIATQTGLPPPIALAVVALVVALIVLIIVHLLTARVSDAILDSRVGMIDRVLGFAFGVARGFILIVIPYMFYEGLGPPDEKTQFPWVRDAAFKPYIEDAQAQLSATFCSHCDAVIPHRQQPNRHQGQPGQQGHLDLLNRDRLDCQLLNAIHVNGRLVTLAFAGKRYYMTAV